MGHESWAEGCVEKKTLFTRYLIVERQRLRGQREDLAMKLFSIIVGTVFLFAICASARIITDSTILRSRNSQDVAYFMNQTVHEAGSFFAGASNNGANSTSNVPGSGSFVCDPIVRQITGYLELSRGGKKTKRYVGFEPVCSRAQFARCGKRTDTENRPLTPQNCLPTSSFSGFLRAKELPSTILLFSG